MCGITKRPRTSTKHILFFLMFPPKARAPHLSNSVFDEFDGTFGASESSPEVVIDIVIDLHVSIVFIKHQTFLDLNSASCFSSLSHFPTVTR